jgi:hypothetical protein
MQSDRAKPTLTPAAGAPAQPGAGNNLFRREGEYWTIAYDGMTFRLRDSKGLRYLVCLLGHPGERFAAVDLFLASTPPHPRTLEPSNPGTLPADDERARLAVTKRVKSVLRRIEEHHPPLGYHLKMTIKTGAHCSYLPDPHHPVRWTT